MTNHPTIEKNSISELQEQVIKLMSREVALSREILANLYEEEAALILHNDQALQRILSLRDQPLQELMEIREERIDKVKEFASLIFKKNQAIDPEKKENSSQSLLETIDVEECEVLVLRDQLITLIEKMNLQNCSNLHIVEHYKDYANLLNEHLDEWGYSLAQPQPKVERRKFQGLTVIE